MRLVFVVPLLLVLGCATTAPRRAAVGEYLAPPAVSALGAEEAEPTAGALTQGTLAGVLLAGGAVKPAMAVLPSLKVAEVAGRDVSAILPLGGALDVASGGAEPVAGLGLTVALTPQRSPAEVGLGVAAVCVLASGCTSWGAFLGLTLAKP